MRRNLWDAHVDRLIRSQHPLEREHYWLGVHAECGYPILAHQKLIHEHIHVQGGSGSGKTSRGLGPLIVQAIRRGDTGIIIIALKTDSALMETVRLECARGGRTFKHFTNVLGRSSYLYNPYQLGDPSKISVSQFVETHMQALRLDYGDGYGKRFFSSQARSWFVKIVKAFPDLESLKELFQKTSRENFENSMERDYCRELIATLQQLAEVEALNCGKRDYAPSAVEAQIRMADVVAENQVAYFDLPAAGETATVKEISNLVASGALAAVRDYEAAYRKPKLTLLVIDEFQQMASGAFKLFLAQARYTGLGIVLANHSEADLMNPEFPGLANVVRTSTAIRMYFSAADPEMEQMLALNSGTMCYPMADRMALGPRMNQDDVKRYSSAPDLCMVSFSRDSGYSCYGGHWFGVKMSHYISAEEYARRSSAPWPEPTPATIVAVRRTEAKEVPPPRKRQKLLESSKQVEVSVSVPTDRPVSDWGKRLNALHDRQQGKSQSKPRNDK